MHESHEERLRQAFRPIAQSCRDLADLCHEIHEDLGEDYDSDLGVNRVHEFARTMRTVFRECWQQGIDRALVLATVVSDDTELLRTACDGARYPVPRDAVCRALTVHIADYRNRRASLADDVDGDLEALRFGDNGIAGAWRAHGRTLDALVDALDALRSA